MNRQRLQKLAGLLKEEISRDEAVTDLGAVQTIVDGKRGVGFITRGGNSSQNWEAIQNMIQDNGLKSMHVKGNEYDAYIIYAQGYANDATELKNIAEKYGGYLHADATAADTRRIGELLGYKKDEIDAYIKKWYPRYLDEITVKPTDSSKQFKQDLVDAMYDDCMDAFDGNYKDWLENGFGNVDSPEVEEAMEALEEKIGITKATDFYYEAPYLVEKMFKDESELEEITVKPTYSGWQWLDLRDIEMGADADLWQYVHGNLYGWDIDENYIDGEIGDAITDDNIDLSDVYSGEDDIKDFDAFYVFSVGDPVAVLVRPKLLKDKKLMDLYHQAINNELEEITVKPSGDITWDSYEKACKSYISNTFDLSQECNFTQLGSTGEEEWQTTVLGSVGVEGFIQLCKENYEEVDHLIQNAAYTRSINNLKDLVKATVFIHESRNTVNLEVVFSFAVVLRFQEASTLGEIVVQPTQKPSGVFIDGKKVKINSIDVDGIDPYDAPDYSDAYACYAEFEDGTELNDEQLEELNDDYYDVVYDCIWDSLHEIVVKPSRSPKYQVGDVIKIKGIHQQNSFEITGVYDNGNDCYTHAPITMYLIGYNEKSIQGKTGEEVRIPSELIDQYWYNVEPTVDTNNSTIGMFTIPEEYVETKAQVDEIVVKSSKKDENYWEWEKDLPKDLNIDWDWADCEYDDDVDEDGNPVFFGTVRGTDQYRDMYEADWGGPHEEASENKLYRIKRIGNLEDLDEIVVKSSKKDENFWEWEKDLPKNIKISWDWDDADYESDLDYETDEEIYFGAVRGTDQYGDMYEANWSNGTDDFTEDAVVYNINRVDNLENLEEIVVKPTVIPTFWRYEKDLPNSIKITWDYNTATIDGRERDSQHAEGSIIGHDQNGDRYHGTWMGWVKYDDYDEIDSISYIQNISKLRNKSLKEITVKPTSQPLRYGNFYVLKPENLPQQKMSKPDAQTYLAKLGPGWRLPTFDELYDIYEKGGLPHLFHWFGTNSLYEFDDGTRAELLSAFCIGGNPEYNSKAEIANAKSAWWSGSRYHIFPVKDATTKKEEPSKLAEILGMDEIAVKPTRSLETIVFGISDSRGWTSFNRLELNKGVKAREQALSWYESIVNDIEEECYEENNGEEPSKEELADACEFIDIVKIARGFYYVQDGEESYMWIIDNTSEVFDLALYCYEFSEKNNSYEGLEDTKAFADLSDYEANHFGNEDMD